MEFNIYGDNSGAVLRLDPRIKLLIFLSGSVVALNCYRLTPQLVYGAFLCAVLALCGKKIDGLKIFCIWTFFAFLRICITLSGKGHPLLIGLVQGLSTLVMFSLPILISLMLLIQTTRINHLLAALQSMKMPSFVMIPLAVLLRFIPTVQDEWNGIQKAMAFRNISLDADAILRAPTKTVEYILIPLLFSCIAVIEEMTAAALARGLDSERRRTSSAVVRMTSPDYIVLAGLIAVVSFALYFGKTGAIL